MATAWHPVPDVAQGHGDCLVFGTGRGTGPWRLPGIRYRTWLRATGFAWRPPPDAARGHGLCLVSGTARGSERRALPGIRHRTCMDRLPHEAQGHGLCLVSGTARGLKATAFASHAVPHGASRPWPWHCVAYPHALRGQGHCPWSGSSSKRSDRPMRAGESLLCGPQEPTQVGTEPVFARMRGASRGGRGPDCRQRPR